MNKNILITITFLSILNLKLFSQDIIINGQVIDKKTNEKISYASIFVYREELGTSCDLDGKFTIKIQTKYKDSCLYIAAIGYNDTIIKISNIKNNISILLIPKIIQLKEVSIKPKKEKTKTIDKIHKPLAFIATFFSLKSPNIVGKYFAFDKRHKDFFMKNIDILFERTDDYNIEPTFYIRIMEYDTINKKPGKDLIKGIYVKMGKCEQEQNYIYSKNIEDLKLQIPKSGIIIAVEWILVNSNFVKTKYQTFYSPIMRGKLNLNSEAEMNLWFLNGGIWQTNLNNHKFNGEPYIDLVIGN